MAAERSRMIKLFRSTLQERSNYSRESRLARNRAVSKTHERLARDAHKAKDDDKGRRMDALKVSPVSMYVSVCPRYSTSGSILITAPVHVKLCKAMCGSYSIVCTSLCPVCSWGTMFACSCVF